MAEPSLMDPAQPADGRPRGPAPATKGRGSRWRTIVEWIVIIAAALIVALIIKTFFIQAFYIPSGSMEPTLKPGDRVLVNKLSYHLHDVHRGDIIVFKRPPGETDLTIKDLIKRVIGLPGDTIQAKDGRVYIDGRLLNEPYLPKNDPTYDLPLTHVPKGEYFVMGDNRGDSKDSRFLGVGGGVGFIPRNLIVGRAFVRVWPLSALGFL